MTAISTLSPASEIDRIFGPVVQARTYRHLLYALISFPLGITYFVMMITGLSVSAGTAIILIGFVFLAVTLMLALTFGRVERSLTQYLLGATFEPPPPAPRGLRALYTDRRAWTSLIYLMLRFPLGVAGFAVSVTMLASVPCMAAPVLYTMVPIVIGNGVVSTSQEAVLVSLFGCILFLLCAHAINGLAAVSRSLATAML